MSFQPVLTGKVSSPGVKGLDLSVRGASTSTNFISNADLRTIAISLMCGCQAGVGVGGLGREEGEGL